MIHEPRATLNVVLKATYIEVAMTQIEMIKSLANINPSLPPDSSGASTHTSKGQFMQAEKGPASRVCYGNPRSYNFIKSHKGAIGGTDHVA